MRVIARIIPGPRWQCGRSVYEQGPAIQAHLAYMKARYEEGSLLIGGPFTTGLSGIAVLEVPDLRAATDLAQSDPAVAAASWSTSSTSCGPFSTWSVLADPTPHP